MNKETFYKSRETQWDHDECPRKFLRIEEEINSNVSSWALDQGVELLLQRIQIASLIRDPGVR